MSGRPATVLPVATLLRVVPDVVVLAAPGAETAHIAGDRNRPTCGRRAHGAIAIDGHVPAVRVCKDCRRTLPALTLTHLTTLGRPTPAELTAVHEARIRAVAAKCVADLEHIREDAIFDGSVSETVTLIEAVANTRSPEHRRHSLTFGGHTAAATTMTLGTLAGTLQPGACNGSRVWITDPPEPGSPVHVYGGIDGTLVTAPAAPRAGTR